LREWTQEELDKLKELRANKVSVLKIAQILNRSYFSIDCKLRPRKRAQNCGVLKPEINRSQDKPQLVNLTKDKPQLVNLTKKVFSIFSQPDPIIRTAWLFDSHFPHNLPTAPLIKFLKDFKPHIFGFGGDNYSADVISHWNQHQFKNTGMDNVMAGFRIETARFASHIGEFIRALPDTKFVYILGNHEDWLEQFCQEFPQIHKPTMQTILSDYKNRIEFVPRGGFYSIGKLHFAHGDQFGTANPAKQAVERTNKSIVFGHHHVYKVWPQFSMVDEKDKHLGIAVPCFCGLAPGYGKGRPNQWMNGFFTACIKRKSGNFTPYVIPVGNKGHFIDFYGKEYY
jgi:hypothetical protein